MLALKWNRIDMAMKNELFSGEYRPSQAELSKLLEIALIENKPEFVKLLLENGTNLKTFLTYGRLYYLYNSSKVNFWVQLIFILYTNKQAI